MVPVLLGMLGWLAVSLMAATFWAALCAGARRGQLVMTPGSASTGPRPVVAGLVPTTRPATADMPTRV